MTDYLQKELTNRKIATTVTTPKELRSNRVQCCEVATT